jgi:VWFA-related protein
MTRLARTVRTLGACALALGSASGFAPRQAGLARGQSVYVVAVRDTSALRRCLPDGVVAPPASAPGPELYPSWAEPFPGAPDRPMRERAEQTIRKENRFSVAQSAESADIVFVLNSVYGAAVEAVVRGPDSESPTALIIRSSMGDAPADTLVQTLALAVPAAAYRKDPTDLNAIGGARIWEGIEAGVNLETANPDALLRAFASGRGKSYGSNRTGATLGPNVVCTVAQPPRAPWVALPDAPPATSPASDPPSKLGAIAGPPGRPSAVRPGVAAIAVPVVATDAQGQRVLDLQTSEFHLFEEDAERDIAGLLSASEPMTASIMVDTSTSVRGSLPAARDAALAFVDALGREDQVLVAAFDSRLYLLCEATRDRAEARRGIERLRVSGNTTRLYDALDTLTAERTSRLTGRRALVLITDGKDTGSAWVTSAGVLDQVRASGVPVYVVRLEPAAEAMMPIVRGVPGGAQIIRAPEGYSNRAEIDLRARRFLDDVAATSGGQVLPVKSPAQLTDVTRRIADEFAHQYLLYYYPPAGSDSAGPGGIRVEVSRPGVTATARAWWLTTLK